MAIVAAAVDHRPMRSPLRPVLAVLLGLVSVALLASGALALGSALFDRTETRSHVLRGAVSRVVVDGTSGDVVLRSGPAGRVMVQERRHFWLREPKLALSLRDGVLSVRVDCGSFGPDCSDDLRITAPAGIGSTDVEVDSGDVTLTAFDSRRIAASADSGDVTVHGARATVALSADSGDVEAEDVSGPASLVTDSGDVTARGLTGATVTASSDSGDVGLALAATPRRVSANTDSGDVDVDVPAERYRVDAGADSGDVRLDGVFRDDLATRRIDAHSDSGDVTVRGH
jgi:Putative adhesin